MNQGPPSLAALASAGRPLPTRIINGYNTSAAIGVDINRVYEIGSGPACLDQLCSSRDESDRPRRRSGPWLAAPTVWKVA